MEKRRVGVNLVKELGEEASTVVVEGEGGPDCWVGLCESCRAGLGCRDVVEASLDLWMCGATGGRVRGRMLVDVWELLETRLAGDSGGRKGVEGYSCCQTLD